MNVLPLVNKGLAMFQWQQDVAAAEKCCQEALEIDPECEAAVATLAQLSLQQGKIDVAMRMFDRQATLARSEPELVNALTYQYVSPPSCFVLRRAVGPSADTCGRLQATEAQVQFMHNYPDMAAELGQMARML